MEQIKKEIQDFAPKLLAASYGSDGSMYEYYLNEFSEEYGKALYPKLISAFESIFQKGSADYNGERDEITVKQIGTKRIVIITREQHDLMPIITFDGDNEMGNLFVYFAHKEGRYKDSKYKPDKPNLEWFEAKGYEMNDNKEGNLVSYGDLRDSTFIYKIEWFFGKTHRCEIELSKLLYFVVGVLQIMLDIQREIE